MLHAGFSAPSKILAVLAVVAGSLALLCCQPPTCVGCWPPALPSELDPPACAVGSQPLQPRLDAGLRLASVASLPALPFEPQPSNSRRRCVLSLALLPTSDSRRLPTLQRCLRCLYHRLAPASALLQPCLAAVFRLAPSVDPPALPTNLDLRLAPSAAFSGLCYSCLPSACADCRLSCSASEPQPPTFIFESILRRSFQTGPPTFVGALALLALPSSNRPPTLRRLLCCLVWPSC